MVVALFCLEPNKKRKLERRRRSVQTYKLTLVSSYVPLRALLALRWPYVTYVPLRDPT